MREDEIAILPRIEISTVRPLCEVHLRDKNRAKELMLTLCFSETIDQCVLWRGHVLRMEEVMC